MLEITGINLNVGAFSLKDVSLSVNKGDYFALLGVSGSGKSVLLEMISGLRQPENGSILLDGVDITRKKIQDRSVGIVFQDSAVFPHMNVARNIEYSLKGRGKSSAEIKSSVLRWAKRLGIHELLNRFPSGLSGGELKRVALARTLAMEPKILLLDEPLSSLDVLLQFDMMQLLSTLNNEGQTIIHVTHDYSEAYALASKLAVMNDGTIVQSGTPEQVFNNPGNAFIARLTGIKNYFICANAEAYQNKYKIYMEGGHHLIASRQSKKNAAFYIKSDEIFINCSFEYANVFPARVEGVFPFQGGADVLLNAGFKLHAHLDNAQWSSLSPKVGDSVRISFSEDAIILLGVEAQ